MLTYTNIQHGFRKENKLTCNEYVFLDMIYGLSRNPENQAGGWCYAKKETLAEEIGVSKQSIFNLMDKLIEAGFLVRHPDTKFLKTTKKWNDVYFSKTEPPFQEPALPEVKKVYSESKESLPKQSKESLPNSNTNNNNRNSNLNTGEFSENENSVFGSKTIVKPLVEENQKPVEAPAGEPGKEGEAGGRPAGAEKPKKEKVKLTNPVPVYPENWATATKEAFDEWLEYRILIKKPYLEVSLKTQLKKLNVFDQATIIETIEESIAQGWRGLFPKVNKDTAKPKKQSLNELSLEILKENLEKIGYNGTEPIHPSLREWDGNE